jgi:hypothetical protein
MPTRACPARLFDYELDRPAGRLLIVVKSAHVFETERAYLLGVLADARAG